MATVISQEQHDRLTAYFRKPDKGLTRLASEVGLTVAEVRGWKRSHAPLAKAWGESPKHRAQHSPAPPVKSSRKGRPTTREDRLNAVADIAADSHAPQAKLKALEMLEEWERASGNAVGPPAPLTSAERVSRAVMVCSGLTPEELDEVVAECRRSVTSVNELLPEPEGLKEVFSEEELAQAASTPPKAG